MRRLLLVPALVLALGILDLSSQAQPPAGNGQGGTGTMAAPGSEYALTPGAGKWLICGASYTGAEAVELGRQLVVLVRKKNIVAYTYNSGAEKRKQQEEAIAKQRQVENPLFPKRISRVRYDDQVAVLIGGYEEIEIAKKALEAVKKWPLPHELHLSSGKPAVDIRYTIGEDGKPKDTEAINPFEHAFVIRNPLLQSSSGQDISGNCTLKEMEMWQNLNRGEKYSLLDCPKRMTLPVKFYVGSGSVMQEGSTKASLGKSWTSSRPGAALEAAGRQANELARFLRTLNFQSYVLHTKNCSLVTVGAFDSPKDPEYQRITQQIASLQQRLAASGMDPLKLSPAPGPMMVPRSQ